MQRRLLFHHHILKRPKTELIRKVYSAQKIKPTKGDFIELVEKDKTRKLQQLANSDIKIL